MNQDVEFIILPDVDFETVIAALTSKGVLIVPYSELDGWRFWAIGVPYFPEMLKLAFVDGLESGRYLIIHRCYKLEIKRPDNQPIDSCWLRYGNIRTQTEFYFPWTLAYR